MSHAGIPPHWSWKEALEAANEIREALNDENLYREYLANIYGDLPNKSHPDLNRIERMRLNTNYLTRMRFCKIDGELELETKSIASNEPKGFKAWFEHPLKIQRENLHLIFGHWATLGGQTDKEKIIATDTGCVWGYKLSAYRLEDSKVYSYDRITK